MADPAHEFDRWVNSGTEVPFLVKGHRFRKVKGGELSVDGVTFRRDEAEVLFKMLTSTNPFARLNAVLVIWGRNRDKILLILALIVAVLLMALVLIRIQG